MTNDELRALVAKATPGPWRVHPNPRFWAELPDADGTYDPAHNRDNDAALVVAAVNALPALLDRLAAAERDAARYRHIRPMFRAFSAHIDGMHLWCATGELGRMAGPTFDAAIDAARAKVKL